jgi:hypothetical protein
VLLFADETQPTGKSLGISMKKLEKALNQQKARSIDGIRPGPE